MGVAGIAFHPDFGSVGKPGFGGFIQLIALRVPAGLPIILKKILRAMKALFRNGQPLILAQKFRGTSREVFRVGQFAKSNIGNIGFNPFAEIDSLDCGVLCASLGDGGANDPKGYGQAINEPQSSIIRIDPLNPEKGKGYGHRQPFYPKAETADVARSMGLRPSARPFSGIVVGGCFLRYWSESDRRSQSGVAGELVGGLESTFATAFDVAGGEVVRFT